MADPSSLDKVSETILAKWPLHYHVWTNNPTQLNKALESNKHDKECPDPRGRTPLHLATTLGHKDCVLVLVKHGCNANAINAGGWNVAQEAVSAGNPDIVLLVHKYRDFQRGNQRMSGIPELLEELQAAPDFYVEMKWEFTSWVPLMSRWCPSDTYKIWKSGAFVRVDTTLIGFDQNVMNWQRGSRTYIFRGDATGGTFVELNHDNKSYIQEVLKVRGSVEDISLIRYPPEVIEARMSSPIVCTILDTDSIAFQKHKSMWGWGGDKSEVVNGYETKLFSAGGVEVVNKTRFEHLMDDEKERAKAGCSSSGGFQSFLGNDQVEEIYVNSRDVVDPLGSNPYSLTMEQYFNPPEESDDKDIGKLKDMIVRRHKFKPTIGLCDSYPLSLQEQVLPIIKLLAISNAHFAKLRDFVALQLPAGFPVKIAGLADEEDALLELAIQQSLLDYQGAGQERDQVTALEALGYSHPTNQEDADIQRALEASLLIYNSTDIRDDAPNPSQEINVEQEPEQVWYDAQEEDDDDEQMRLAIALSQQEMTQSQVRAHEEDEELRRIIELSLLEK